MKIIVEIVETEIAILILDTWLINDGTNIDEFLCVYRIFSLLSNRYLYLKPRCTEKNPSNRDIYVCECVSTE